MSSTWCDTHRQNLVFSVIPIVTLSDMYVLTLY
jgi:hypothetical protein